MSNSSSSQLQTGAIQQSSLTNVAAKNSTNKSSIDPDPVLSTNSTSSNASDIDFRGMEAHW